LGSGNHRAELLDEGDHLVASLYGLARQVLEVYLQANGMEHFECLVGVLNNERLAELLDELMKRIEKPA
jgi:hypothetical protein